MLLRSYEIVEVLPGVVDPQYLRVRADLSDDIGEVLPYLNAVDRDVTYTPGVPSLTFRKGLKLITLTPRQANMGQVLDREDAVETLNEIRDHINDVWGRHESITPIYERREVKAKDILILLPKTNCRECGLPTCFAFAMALVKEQKRLRDCPALGLTDSAESREALVKMLRWAGLDGAAE